MQFSGKYRLNADFRSIKKCLKSPITIKALHENCISVENLDKNTILAAMRSLLIEGQITHYLFHFYDPGEKIPYLETDWQATDPEALLPKGCHTIRFSTDGPDTIMEVDCEYSTTYNGKLLENNPVVSDAIVSDYFSNFVSEFDRLQMLEGSGMKQDKPEFEDVLNEAKNPVEELEHEAEEAAARGFFGGPQVWALSALAVLVILLLVFY